MVAKDVFLGSGDIIEITILDSRSEPVQPIPFVDNGVDRMVLFNFDDDSVMLDSAETSNITFDNQGKIFIMLGDTDPAQITKNRSYKTYIKAYSASFPDGQTIVHPKRRDSNLSVVFN